MRYAAINQAIDVLGNYGGFIPAAQDSRTLPPPGKGRFQRLREPLFGPATLRAGAVHLLDDRRRRIRIRVDARARRGAGDLQRVRLRALPHAAALHGEHAGRRRDSRRPPITQALRHPQRARRHRSGAGDDARDAARGITRFRRSRASGIAGRSSTTARWRRSRTGSTRGGCATTTCRPDGSASA